MRRAILVLLAILALVGSPTRDSRADPAAAGGASVEDWPGFLGPNGNAKSPATGLLLDWPENGPPLVWDRAIGEGYSMPSVAGGRLFAFDRRGDSERLTCIDARTGRELWHTEYPTAYEDSFGYSNGPRSSPVVDGDRVYTFGAEGRLRCQRVVDGELVWEIDTNEKYGVIKNFFGVGSTPVIEGDLLIVPIGGSPPASPDIESGEVQGNGTGIVAFDKMTGEERYRLTDELASYSSPVLATVNGRRWGFALMRGGLVAFEPTGGKIEFHYPWRAKKLYSVNAANPVVVGDTVVVSECYGPGSSVLRFKPGGYDVVWKDPRRDRSLAPHWATPIHHDGYLYGSTGRNTGDAELRAIELATGKVAWRIPGLGRSTMLFVDGHLIVLTEDGKLLVVRAKPESYQQIAEAVLRGPVGPEGEIRPLLTAPAWSAPILARGYLYARGKDRLVCLDLNRPSASVTGR
jgi:outer membrane protein assembly factor BamB